MDQIPQKKLKLLLYGDSPIATTGLGRLHKYLLKALHSTGKFDITVVGINHKDVRVTGAGIQANYDRAEYPYEIISPFLTGDDWGINPTNKLIIQGGFDLVIMSYDMNRITPFLESLFRAKQTHGTKFMIYVPIDRMNVMPEEMPIFGSPDYILTYSDYTKNLLLQRQPDLKSKMDRIWLPLDLADFPELPEEEVAEFKKQYFNTFDKNPYIITNVNRNQFRKDLARTMAIVKEYMKSNSRAALYLHTRAVDEGGDIRQNLMEFGYAQNQARIAEILDAGAAYPQDVLNKIYRASDVIISTSQGEGYGYSTVEAMATKRPLLVPRNTSFTELVGANEERGYLMDCKGWTVAYGVSNCMRDLADVDSGVAKLKELKKNQEATQAKIEAGYNFVRDELNVPKILGQWLEVFRKMGI